jgi:hypothetical protein
MNRRNSPLEIWESGALDAYARRKGLGTGSRFVALLDAERLTHRARFLMRSSLLPRVPSGGLRKERASAAATMEHRLFLLFAE